jgi:guanylate kinase
MDNNEVRGGILIITGPHGAGKDSLRKALLGGNEPIGNIVRHTTRPAADCERPELDYHFVSPTTFECLAIAGRFAQYSAYPEAMTGTTWEEVNSNTARFQVSLTTMNLEDALELRSTLQAAGLTCTVAFVSPVALSDFEASEEPYLAELERRMRHRNRQTDAIQLRLSKASQYRLQFLTSSAGVYYIANAVGESNEVVGSRLLSVANFSG